MTDRPIIFSGPMVQALLDGRKTQTRRLATSPLRRCEVGDRLWVRESIAAEELSRPQQTRAATLAERRLTGRTSVVEIDELDGADGIRYLADDAWEKIANTPEAAEAWFEAFHYGIKNDGRPGGYKGKTIPSIHMPRWASRLTLIVEGVRVEPLRQITDADAVAEGIEPAIRTASGQFYRNYGNEACPMFPYGSYRSLWNSLHGDDSWDSNPDVLVLTFRVERGNIDSLGAAA